MLAGETPLDLLSSIVMRSIPQVPREGQQEYSPRSRPKVEHLGYFHGMRSIRDRAQARPALARHPEGSARSVISPQHVTGFPTVLGPPLSTEPRLLSIQSNEMLLLLVS
jgi:hypothetical protein